MKITGYFRKLQFRSHGHSSGTPQGPADRDALAASLGTGNPSAAPVTETAALAVRLRAAGWTIGSIADGLRCSRRTVQRYLRRAAA
jgi:DNA-binding NarL/FixJ family response regulator